MIILSFLILLLLSPAMSEEYPSTSEEFDDIEQMIQKLEQEIPESSSVKAPQPTKAAVSTKTTVAPTVKTVESVTPSAVKPHPAPIVAAEKAETANNPAMLRSVSNNYIDEKPYKQAVKEASIKGSLSGPSNFSSPSRDVDMDRDDVYHYSYMPPLYGDNYDESGAFKGAYGHLVFTVYGSYVIHYKAVSNRSTFGGDVQLGWQFDLSPVAIAILADAGVRGSNISGSSIYTLGPRARITVRVNEWFFPFLEGGVEFGKVESMSNWVYPYTVLSGGFMFKIGRLDRKSEYSLYRDYNVARMLIIVAGDIITSPELNPNTPDSGLIKVGLSIELF
jgi:opacity protein-like surface antigen